MLEFFFFKFFFYSIFFFFSFFSWYLKIESQKLGSGHRALRQKWVYAWGYVRQTFSVSCPNQTASGGTRKFFVGGIEGVKCISEGAKLKKIAKNNWF